ncbi:MAG: hypothetical protein KBE27_01575 [Syntrophorhabdaceae bacterium]|nr:hypothetical protein [Syntrophorhabdales bacterium]MBP9560494.1 hypothetical protein [Syntrophorhabdaceae bacterium]
MKAIVFLAVGLLAVLILSGVSFSLMDRVLLYGGGGQGRVTFDHRVHASKGMVCNDCHATLFDTQKKALFTMDDHYSDKKCFGCHDGKKAFNECGECHRGF